MRQIRGGEIALIFQEPMTSFSPVHTIGNQIVETVRFHMGLDKGAARERAVEMLRLVGIPKPERRVDEYAFQLSGGLRQRAMIATALSCGPRILIADEPTTALDVTVQAQVLAALATAREETGAAMVLITHDLGVVAGQADRVVVMYAGKPVEMGTAEEIFYRPRMPYTLGLLGSLPRLDAERGTRLTPIRGVPPSLINLPPGCPFTPRCPLARPRCDSEEPELRPTTAPEHTAACHYWQEVEDRPATHVFAVTSEDAALPSELATPPVET